jgi:hypothetical protein
MRRRLVLMLLLTVLPGCIPEGRKVQTARQRSQPTRAKPRPRPAPQELTSPQLRQCLADLGNAGARYTALPDRTMAGGCSAIGTVKLIDVGMPVTNLGAMKCRLAERFAAWAGSAVQNAASVWLESNVVKIESFGTYSCRPVNNREGNRLSEHGRSNAVDISAFVLANGRRITVKEGWNGSDPAARDFLRAVHKAACRRFSIVIGPDANALHHDHLHFDMGGNGPYCH